MLVINWIDYIVSYDVTYNMTYLSDTHTFRNVLKGNVKQTRQILIVVSCYHVIQHIPFIRIKYSLIGDLPDIIRFSYSH